MILLVISMYQIMISTSIWMFDFCSYLQRISDDSSPFLPFSIHHLFLTASCQWLLWIHLTIHEFMTYIPSKYHYQYNRYADDLIVLYHGEFTSPIKSPNPYEKSLHGSIVVYHYEFTLLYVLPIQSHIIFSESWTAIIPQIISIYLSYMIFDVLSFVLYLYCMQIFSHLLLILFLGTSS